MRSITSSHVLLLRAREHFTHSDAKYSVWRHISVLEASHRALLSFLPRGVTNQKSLACDPQPPPPGIRVNEYDDEFFKGVEDSFAVRMGRKTRRDEAADRRLLERLVPDPAFRGQLEVTFYSNI